MVRVAVAFAALLVLSLAPTPAAADTARCEEPLIMRFVGGPSCEPPPLLPSASFGALATKELWGTNADGTQWRITYFTHLYASEAEADRHAQMHLDGALSSYANLTSWGLVSADPDGVLDLTLDGCDCIYSGFQANIHMFPRANDILPLVPGLAYRGDESEVAELIVGHELFHHFQYSHQQWRLGQWLVEGMARFSETIHVPDITYTPGALLFYPNDNGMNGFLANPARTISQHSYDWSIVWGWLYAHEGGTPFLKAVLEESATATGDPNVAGPAAISRAMDRVPGGTFATFEEAYQAFAAALLTKEGLVWGAPDGTQVHDWATYLMPVARQNFAASPFALPNWGIQVHHARPTTPDGAAVVSYAGAPIHVARMYTLADGGATLAPALPVNAVAGVDDAALLMVRTTYVSGDSTNAAGLYAVGVVR